MLIAQCVVAVLSLPLSLSLVAYDIEANAVCVAALNVAGGGAGCPGGGVVANAGVGNAYVQTFCRWAAAPGGGVLRYSSAFSNDINDVINNLAPLAAARYFP